MTSRGRSPPPPTPGDSREQPNLKKVVERGECTFPYRVEVGVRGLASRFLREAWGYQEQAMSEDARLGAGFPDSRALCIPLVSKFPPSFASAGGACWPPAQPARDTGGSVKD